MLGQGVERGDSINDHRGDEGGNEGHVVPRDGEGAETKCNDRCKGCKEQDAQHKPGRLGFMVLKGDMGHLMESRE